MKIDSDLRAAINAAAKTQEDYSYDHARKIMQQAVDDLMKKKPGLKRRVGSLIQKTKVLSDKIENNHKKIKLLLQPLGLCVYDETIEAQWHRDLDCADAQKFKAAGGQLPSPMKRKWKADTVIARLAAAKPEQRHEILKEYGIDWS